MVSVQTSALLTPVGFIQKWSRNKQSEKRIAQAHFNDLCRLLDHPTPADEDPIGDYFAFEKTATKIGGGKGYADVWKKNYFAWEYKSRDENLDAAHKQLITYAPALGNPPLQVVCDFKRYRIHTAWTNTVPEMHEIALDDFIKPARLQILRDVFHSPEKLKPVRIRSILTKEAADKFATIAFRLQGRGLPEEIAHFVNQLVFCFFADSVGLLPQGMWSKLLKRAQDDPAGARVRFDKLFTAMRTGEDYGAERIVYFNGGLFDGQRALPLDEGDIGLLRAANTLDWGQIDPSIFGSLFERFLDPQKRAQIGAHYTDAEKIQKIIEPVILRPLREEWERVDADIKALLSGKTKPPMRTKPKRRMQPLEAAEERRAQFLKRMKEIKILDPACGSGNFLYLALQGVKDLEHHINLESEKLGLKPQLPFIGPEILKGIELNPVAAELARTTIWIGDIQWRMRNGINSDKRPVLEKLNTIVCGDALISKNDARFSLGGLLEVEWPEAEFVVGNPPFLGGKLMRRILGDQYLKTLFEFFDGAVPAEADLVAYWFEKAREQLARKRTSRVGFVSTNSIRGGVNRVVLDRIGRETRLFEVWADESWVVDGAAVRVSLICFGKGTDSLKIDGRDVATINSDLTSYVSDLTKTHCLIENSNVAYMGSTKGGAFDISGELARSWISLPMNPNNQRNIEVMRPWRNGMDLTRRASDKWIVDFGWKMTEMEASLFEAPFQYVKEAIRPERLRNRREVYAKNWWRHIEARPALRSKMLQVDRYICTPRVSRHRLFVWLEACVVPDSATIAIMRDDETTFGILHSRFHESWSLRQGTWLGVGNDPRYTPTTTFGTFPFPQGLTPNIPAKNYASDPRAVAITSAAKRLDELRVAWLNPPDLVEIVPEVVPGYPHRILPKTVEAAVALKKRTLTNLYNERPQWLVDAHRNLDSAVAAAYGWPVEISEDDALAKLLELNLTRTAVSVAEESEANDL
jgi:type II restriction/modification system DNA methylase subunit YeeA